MGGGNLPLLSKDLRAVAKEESQAFHKRKASLLLLAAQAAWSSTSDNFLSPPVFEQL